MPEYYDYCYDPNWTRSQDYHQEPKDIRVTESFACLTQYGERDLTEEECKSLVDLGPMGYIENLRPYLGTVSSDQYYYGCVWSDSEEGIRYNSKKGLNRDVEGQEKYCKLVHPGQILFFDEATCPNGYRQVDTMQECVKLGEKF